MEKKNYKRNNELKAKITDQGDIIKLEEKSINLRLDNGLYLADRGDSRKILHQSHTCEKPRNIKLSADKDIFKHTAPNINILAHKNVRTSDECKYKNDETLNSKPINVRSRVKTYIQNLKFSSDLKSKDINSTIVYNNNSKLENPLNVSNVMKANEAPNSFQNDELKLSFQNGLAETNLGSLVSNEFEKCNKEGYKRLGRNHFVDSTVESQINEILRLKQTKEGSKDNDHFRKVHTELLDPNERINIKEKHAKSKVSHNLKESSPQNDSDNKRSKEILDSKSVSTRTKDSLKKSESSRRPVITTIRSKRDAKVYKAVTFTELKPRETTPIEIKIPTVKRKEKAKTSDKNTDISSSSKEKKKKFRKRKHAPSPDLIKKGESPPTEVAKWAPSCVNKHTIPYYEAWIDTTLAAISKSSRKDKIWEKQNLLKSFKKFLERPPTPDLIYDHMDEKYTGKIKIKQRHKN